MTKKRIAILLVVLVCLLGVAIFLIPDAGYNEKDDSGKKKPNIELEQDELNNETDDERNQDDVDVDDTDDNKKIDVQNDQPEKDPESAGDNVTDFEDTTTKPENNKKPEQNKPEKPSQPETPDSSEDDGWTGYYQNKKIKV